MIYDKITNLNRYKGLDASLDFAIEYIKNTNFAKLIEENPSAEIEIAHDKLYAVTNTYDKSNFEQVGFHRNDEYIEIHIPVTGKEIIHFYNPEISEENLSSAHYTGEIADSNEDNQNGGGIDKLTLSGGGFALFFPKERFHIDYFDADDAVTVNKITVLSRYTD